jgi:hypothetical protein
MQTSAPMRSSASSNARFAAASRWSEAIPKS